MVFTVDVDTRVGSAVEVMSGDVRKQSGVYVRRLVGFGLMSVHIKITSSCRQAYFSALKSL
jgi:uncharacterized membrane protein (DUF4010 family)